MKEAAWRRLVTVLVVVAVVLAGTSVALTVVYYGHAAPRWHQVLSYTYPVTIGSWDENNLTWNTKTPDPEFVHRFTITGLAWRIFVGGRANDTADKPTLSVTLFALYPNGSFVDAILLDLIFLDDLVPFGFEIRDRTDAGSFQVFIIGLELESYGFTVMEWR